MKRFLKNNQHQLSMREQEEIWRGIQEKSGREGAPRKRRGLGMPIFGLTSLTAAVLLVAVWFGQDQSPQVVSQQMNQDRDLERIPISIPERENPKKTDPAVMGQVAPAKEAGTEAVTPMDMDSEKSEKFAIEAVEEALSKQAGAELNDKMDPPQATPENSPPDIVHPKTGRRISGETFDKFSIGRVEKALEKQAGVVAREGELFVRGGRSGEVQFQIDGVAPEALQMPRDAQANEKKRTLADMDNLQEIKPGSVTGGTTPPNGETFELMYHEHAGVNPFIATEDDALSTFAIDVDNASYTLMRSYLERGSLPPADAIRVEEFVNFFGAGYAKQTKDVFRIHTDGSESRFGEGYQMLRVGLKGMDIDSSSRKPANLIFVIDTSGSMSRENRLGLVKKSLHILLDELSEGDQVGIVTYGNNGRVLLEPTDISRKMQIVSAIDRLTTGGATNACEGLELAYDLARRNYDASLINRLVLCSDGVANMGGATRAEEMLAQIRRQSDEGITLSTIGFGMGNYNDVLMEKLANQGDGNYFYVDKLEESKRVFRANLTGMLQTIAREVKIQVEFDPDQVQRWRLLGYENRDVADRDFRNDNVDAGEVGAGHEVTALYELKLKPESRSSQLDDDFRDNELGTVRVRYEYPAHDTQRAGTVKEIEQAIGRDDLSSRFSRTSSEYRIQVLAAEFAEILRNSFWAKESQLASLIPMADGLAKEFDGDSDNKHKAKELARLIRAAADLHDQRESRETPGHEKD